MNRSEYERALAVKTAWYYYIENYTQQDISRLLGVSRAKVIALLERARQTGVIQFTIRQEGAYRMQVEQSLIARFHLSDAFVVPGAGTLPNLKESIAQAAAMYILRRAEPNAFINIGYGDTTSRVLNHLATAAESPLNVVSLTGGVNCYLPDNRSSVFSAHLYLIPAPLMLSSRELRDSMRQEPGVDEIFRMIPLSSMSVVGIGGMDDEATIVKNGILTKNDFTLLRMQGGVGDILSHFLDKNGVPISPSLEQRLISTPPELLRRLDNVIGVAGGPDKAAAILAALQGGYLDVLITDAETAELLLQMSGQEGGFEGPEEAGEDLPAGHGT
ncbi:MAG: sugar-binding transcriptional regulator [Oscillibacter sp.]|nr:sugar-binding transcriptional regulator [Oscillibacter sp.]